MKYFIIDAFTDQPFGGNPAGVVLLDTQTFPKEDLMLKIAAELRYSETAFILRHSEQEFTIRYFTPKAEVDLCGHATIASFFLLHQIYGCEQILHQISSREQILHQNDGCAQIIGEFLFTDENLVQEDERYAGR